MKTNKVTRGPHYDYQMVIDANVLRIEPAHVIFVL